MDVEGRVALRNILLGLCDTSVVVRTPAEKQAQDLVAAGKQDMFDLMASLLFDPTEDTNCCFVATFLMRKMPFRSLDLSGLWERALSRELSMQLAGGFCTLLGRMENVVVSEEVVQRARQQADTSLQALAIWLLSGVDATAAVELALRRGARELGWLEGVIENACEKNWFNLESIFRRKLSARESTTSVLSVMSNLGVNLKLADFTSNDWDVLCSGDIEGLCYLCSCCENSPGWPRRATELLLRHLVDSNFETSPHFFDALIHRLTEQDVDMLFAAGERSEDNYAWQSEVLPIVFKCPALPRDKKKSLLKQSLFVEGLLENLGNVWEEFDVATLDEFVAHNIDVVANENFAWSVCGRECITPVMRRAISAMRFERGSLDEVRCIYAVHDVTLFEHLALLQSLSAEQEAAGRKVIYELKDGWSPRFHTVMPARIQEVAITVMLCLRKSVPIRHLLYIVLEYALVAEVIEHMVHTPETVNYVVYLLRRRQQRPARLN